MDGGVKVTPCTLQIPQCFCPEEYTFAVDALDMVPELVRALPDPGPSSATPKATRQQRRRMGTAFRPASPEWILSPARCLGAGQLEPDDDARTPAHELLILSQSPSASARQFDDPSPFRDLKRWRGRTLIQRLTARAVAESLVESLRISMPEVPPPLPLDKRRVKVNFVAVQPGNHLHLLLVQCGVLPRAAGTERNPIALSFRVSSLLRSVSSLLFGFSVIFLFSSSVSSVGAVASAFRNSPWTAFWNTLLDGSSMAAASRSKRMIVSNSTVPRWIRGRLLDPEQRTEPLCADPVGQR
ncbi:hypothetical protein ACO22_06268 [Paracoccidioides brasiliensis]|uniref:Uncharacterized protein n=1 Tax=Paracoccidioides brasiliensis TaxID=121759 RepID=A0A1D2J889_PARBR|nr:hypothetical protein ACO22_06268 [Paracoccidioides brasiliensis]